MSDTLPGASRFLTAVPSAALRLDIDNEVFNVELATHLCLPIVATVACGELHVRRGQGALFTALRETAWPTSQPQPPCSPSSRQPTFSRLGPNSRMTQAGDDQQTFTSPVSIEVPQLHLIW